MQNKKQLETEFEATVKLTVFKDLIRRQIDL
jgi:hypothetical protein